MKNRHSTFKLPLLYRRPLSTSSGVKLIDRNSTASLLENVDYVISDCDGVLWIREAPIINSNKVINKLQSLGKRVIFATNNNLKTRREILDKLHEHGFDANIDQICAINHSVGVYLKMQQFKGVIFTVGEPCIFEELKGHGLECIGSCNVPAIHRNIERITLDPLVNAVVFSFDHQISACKLIELCSYGNRIEERFFITTNMDNIIPHYDPLKIPGTGAYVNLIESVIKRRPITLNKSSQFFFDYILNQNPQLNPERCLIIGDRLDMDIAFGLRSKLRYQLLVGSGVHNLNNINQHRERGETNLLPTHYANSLGDLEPFLGD